MFAIKNGSFSFVFDNYWKKFLQQFFLSTIFTGLTTPEVPSADLFMLKCFHDYCVSASEKPLEQSQNQIHQYYNYVFVMLIRVIVWQRG